MKDCLRCKREVKRYIKGQWCGSCKIWKARQRRKVKAINHLGGKCVKCGYKKCYKALEFHHLNPSAKEFGIASSTNRSWEKTKEELKKCALVCANCHREIHAENIKGDFST